MQWLLEIPCRVSKSKQLKRTVGLHISEQPVPPLHPPLSQVPGFPTGESECTLHRRITEVTNLAEEAVCVPACWYKSMILPGVRLLREKPSRGRNLLPQQEELKGSGCWRSVELLLESPTSVQRFEHTRVKNVSRETDNAGEGGGAVWGTFSV